LLLIYTKKGNARISGTDFSVLGFNHKEVGTLMTKVNKINSHNIFHLYHKSLLLYRRRPNNRRKNSLPGESEKNSSKELDPETGFYYYGARYLDPRTSRWLSGDPALGEYLPGAPVNDEAKKGNGNLPGQGGVFNVVNLHVYHYAGNNPVKYTDPDGNALNQPVILKQIETVAKIAKFYSENKDALQKIGIGAAKAAMGIGIAGLGVGGGGAIAIGTGGTATLGGVAVAGAAISAGGVYVGAGVADILDGIVMMAQGNGSGGGNNRTDHGQQRYEEARGETHIGM
jgi:RHS repeat-associated protein